MGGKGNVRQRKKSLKQREGTKKEKVAKEGQKLATSEEQVHASSHAPFVGILVALLFFVLGLVAPPLLRRSSSEMAGNSSEFERELQQQELVQEPVQEPVPAQQRTPCSKAVLEDFWSDVAVPGYHIICLRAAGEETEPHIKASFYENGLRRSAKASQLPYFLSWEDLKASLRDNLNLKPKGMVQPWALFSTAGVRLVNETDTEPALGQYPVMLTRDYGVILLYEGGQFLWPGVRIGFRRTISLYSVMPPGSPDLVSRHRLATLETLSVIPLVLSVTGFLTEAECEHVQELAAPSMEYSEVVLMDKDAGRPASDFRTSQTTFVHAVDDIMKDIDERTASLVRLPRIHQEAVQVLRYGHGEKYDSHHDYFDPSLYQNDKWTLEHTIQHGRRNRLATVFWYLSDVEEGGETAFPRFNGVRAPKDCEAGLMVKPEKGKVIIFYSMTPDGVIDPFSLHGACPVKKGIKWAANKWVWNLPMQILQE